MTICLENENKIFDPPLPCSIGVGDIQIQGYVLETRRSWSLEAPSPCVLVFIEQNGFLQRPLNPNHYSDLRPHREHELVYWLHDTKGAKIMTFELVPIALEKETVSEEAIEEIIA